MKTNVLTVSVILFLSFRLFAQTHIPAGYVSGTWLASNSPYIIDGEIKIDTSDQLIIQPGVDVLFSGHYKLIICGRLLAEGTETDSIHFTAQDTAVGWHGLRFDHTDLNGQDSSKLDYCRLDYGKAYGIDYFDSCGGAIFCDSSSLLLINNSFIARNYTSKHGGAAYLLHSNILFKRTKIFHNRARYSGGAILADSSNLNFLNLSISFNRALEGSGGAIFTYNIPSSTAHISKVEIYSNEALISGGGICSCYFPLNIIADSLIISNNSALFEGGGISGNINIIYSHNFVVYSNVAIDGGGLFTRFGNGLTINNIIFCYNQSSEGGAIKIANCENIVLKNLTVTHNYANIYHGEGIYIEGNSEVIIKNCIVRFNDSLDTGDIDSDSTSHFTVDFSSINGDYEGSNNIYSDPKFNGWWFHDYTLSWDHYPEPDSTKSPCIDTGDPALTDPDGTRSDMGAIPFEQVYTPLSGGNISGPLLCSKSPYYVYGDLTVLTGNELTIEPCVHLVFQGDYRLTVEGGLMAEGTSSDKISFYAADTVAGWDGIRFLNQNTNGQDSSKLVNCRIKWGTAEGGLWDDYGGGIYLSNSSDVSIRECLISNNKALSSGGGIYANDNSHPVLKGNIICRNYAPYGGGIYSYSSNVSLRQCVIEQNSAKYGGGVYQYGASTVYSGTSIRNNYASLFGGGIYFEGYCTPSFDPANRSSLYLNYAVKAGTDIFGALTSGTHPVLNLDTLTVAFPDEHHVYPYGGFTLDFLHGGYRKLASDLYVSPSGDDSNPGLTPDLPMKTLYGALLKIRATPAEKHTIYLMGGDYSNSTTGERFPLNWKSHVDLVGITGEFITLRGEDKTNFFYFYDDENCTLKYFVMQGGYADKGGAMNLDYYSAPVFDSLWILGNFATESGGGIYCYDHSSPVIRRGSISLNSTDVYGGGIYCESYSSPVIEEELFEGNSAYSGGAIYSSHVANLVVDDVIFKDNSATSSGGAYVAYYNSDPVMNEVDFINNTCTSGYGGAFYVSYLSDPDLQFVKFDNNNSFQYGGAIYLIPECNP